jgi:hypothetical protein
MGWLTVYHHQEPARLDNELGGGNCSKPGCHLFQTAIPGPQNRITLLLVETRTGTPCQRRPTPHAHMLRGVAALHRAPRLCTPRRTARAMAQRQPPPPPPRQQQLPQQQQQQQQQEQQQQQLPQQPFCLARNGEACACAQASGAWLQAAPRGAYTTARTVGGGARVLKLSSHIERLATSANLMVQSDEQVWGQF